jgi:uncharacterized membrane protein YhaH (DUF805 family)
MEGLRRGLKPISGETLMFGIGLQEVLVLLYLFLIFGFPAWMAAKIARKAGLSSWWSAAMLIPILNIVMVWIFAFVSWPAIDRSPQPET